MQELLKPGAWFDWISPSFSIVEGLLGMQSLSVNITGTGMTGNEIVRLLQRNGVRVGQGRFLVNDELVLTVSNREKALKILKENGL